LDSLIQRLTDQFMEHYLVFGLARSGLATVRWLREQGHTVYVMDEDPAKVTKACAEGGIAWADQVAWADQRAFKILKALIQSPGIPMTHPLTKAARQAGVAVRGDVDLFRQAHPKATIVGITGTNGKSTTTALIGHILKECGIPVAVGGNIGVPVLVLPELPNKGIYVLELSSYQLELSQNLGLTAAAWTNITPDHLERHGTLENYRAAKLKIFDGPAHPPQSVISIDDVHSQEIFEKRTRAHPGYFTPVRVNQPLDHGVFVQDGILMDSTGGGRVLTIGDLSGLERLKGEHNYQNIAIAYGICKNLNLSPQEIMGAVKTFPGLVHRQEYVRTLGTTVFINDSKATNADATSHALKAYDSIYWLLGGVPKRDGIDSLLPLLSSVKKAYLFGEASEKFSKILDTALPYERCGDMLAAIQRAYKDALNDAVSGEKATVLLSPACASFDQFRDYEHRGDIFKGIVNELKE
jgi:UDP-N-acetylmuramoylalanine--D-glutamate ligase